MCLYVFCFTNTQHKTCGPEIGVPPVAGRGTDNTGLCWLRLAQWPTQHKSKSPAALHCGFATNISWVYVSLKGFYITAACHSSIRCSMQWGGGDTGAPIHRVWAFAHLVSVAYRCQAIYTNITDFYSSSFWRHYGILCGNYCGVLRQLLMHLFYAFSWPYKKLWHGAAARLL